MDDGGFGKLTYSILSNRCIGESRERAWEGFCVGKAGKPATDLTCTRWRTHTGLLREAMKLNKKVLGSSISFLGII